ncbi:hypothetical protein P4637_00645 [Halalkalibacterium halodurans]|uniref:hypothetical protein n=1 Tax=Halalkalibacterium halodurans TaxID=86665 RepID=UPI002E1BB6E1|nr:hypothetical protein [Halalkalibacterium halodurans]MED4083367.1 hypothetical protein [Halalkalibacterium halodurans]MED4105109.1 hypothetical protein [Halalkalibacterium halodurans]MED4109427.1 hypothetical protein [Halalkalibacterium halodurans]MED4124235.1 hypothetical protein [Halalkalibacterium halodurans]
MERVKSIGKHVIGFAVFIIFCMMFSDEATELYQLMKDRNGETVEAIVKEKTLLIICSELKRIIMPY